MNTHYVSAVDGWRQLTSVDGEKEEKKVLLSARPAELWDSEFDRATFHSLLGFRATQSALLTEGNTVCGTCASRFPLPLDRVIGSYAANANVAFFGLFIMGKKSCFLNCFE